MVKNVLLLLICAFSLKSGSSQQCLITPPSHLSLTNINSCSATLHWKPSPGAQEYQVRYKVAGTSMWFPKVSAGIDTFYTFSDLDAITKYEFNIRSFCTDGSKSAFKKITGTTLSCTLPTIISTDSIDLGQIKVSIQTPCPYDTIYYRYGLVGAASSVQFTMNPDSILFTGIVSNQPYEYAVSTCPLSMNTWTPADTFLFAFTRPNILVIVLDDSRYDFFSCNGAPDFFQTPSIDRIASEGVNFFNHFVTHSLCAPSRATMFTGLYSGKTGIKTNEESPFLNKDLPNIFQLLDSAGYYTALLGKNQLIFNYDDGWFDYWLEALGLDGADPISFNYKGQDTGISGFLTEILTDSAISVIQNSSEPFFIWLSYRAPHTPFNPSLESDGLYNNEDMPLKEDTAKYEVNYPSFLDALPLFHYADPIIAADEMENTFEVMRDVDINIARLLAALDITGKILNTFILFTSDNGHMLGEHSLDIKRVAYEPSMRIPLFIRYPPWFPEPAVVTDRITSNLDIAPTLLEAAGINGDYNMDGFSVREIFNGDSFRNQHYYHYWYTTENRYKNLPFIKAVRDLQYKYVYYGCSNDTTEEFFDLVNDPLELTNLINNSPYDSLIQTYREVLIALSVQFGDTLAETTLPCYINNPVSSRKTVESFSEADIIIYPNPANEYITLTLPQSEINQVILMDEMERIVLKYYPEDASAIIELSSLPPGMYFLQFRNEHQTTVQKVVIMH